MRRLLRINVVFKKYLPFLYREIRVVEKSYINSAPNPYNNLRKNMLFF